MEVDVAVEIIDGRQHRRAVAVRGHREDPVFEGYTCIKGRQLIDQLDHVDRVTQVLQRVDNQLVPVAASSALDHIASELQRIIDTHGPRAVATYVGTGGFQASAAVPLAEAWHKAIGSPSFHTSITIDQPAKATAPLRIGWWHGGFHGWTSSDVWMAIGTNPIVSSYSPLGGLQGTNPVVELRRAKARGLKLIVIDPRRTELAANADIHLQVVPGEDAALLAGMLRLVLTNGWHDAEFCAAFVDGLAELACAIDSFTPEVTAARCGISVDDFVAATQMFAAAARGTAGTGTGPNMAPRASLSEHLAIALNVVCGRVNRIGDIIDNPGVLLGIKELRAEVIAPSPATLDAGPHSRIEGKRGYRGQLPTNVLADEILTEGEGQIRALIVLGGNPVVAWPDQAKTLAAMNELELLVVVDHRQTATTVFADWVIPAKLGLERSDVTHIMDRWFATPYLNATNDVADAPGEAMAEWEVLWELSARMNTIVQLPGGDMAIDTKPADTDIIALMFPRTAMDLADRWGRGGVVAPMVALTVQPARDGAESRFTLAPNDIVGELAELAGEESTMGTMAGYDPAIHRYRLVSRRDQQTLNSLGPELARLRQAGGTTNPAWMHPDDVAELGVVDGDLIDIASPRGSVRAVVQSSDAVRRKVISMAHSWGGADLHDERVRLIGTPTNRLVDNLDGADHITGQAVQSAIPVSVERVAALV
jgi:anaerobic selenocysteine-containing dehydrogenase